MGEPSFDPRIREKAQLYYKKRRLARWVGMVYSLLFAAAFFATPSARWLVARVGSSGWNLALYLALVITAYLGGDLVISYFVGYRVDRRFGLSTQTLGAWLLDGIKSWVLGLILAVPLLLGLHWLTYRFAGLWWLYAGLGWIAVTVILANLAPVVVLPLFFKSVPLQDEELRGRLETLFDRSGASIRGIFVMNMSSKTNAANAMVTGTANTRRMILGDTLTRNYTPDEIEVVMAHELGHHHLRHMPILLAVGSAFGLLVFWLASLILPVLWIFLGYNAQGIAPAAGVSDPAFLPVIPFVVGLVFSMLGPFQSAVSRKLEYDSDEYALQLTGKSEAFMGAMARLADQNLSVLDPPKLDVLLWHDHPPIGQRIEHAKAFGGGSLHMGHVRPRP